MTLHPQPDDLFCLAATTARTWGDFAKEVSRYRPALQSADAICNLASSRFDFSVLLAAALLNGQTVLLPPARADQAVQSVMDGWEAPLCVTGLADLPPGGGASPLTPAELLEALAGAKGRMHIFTSGSTGKPVRQIKSWEMLRVGASITHEIVDRAGLSPGNCLIAGTTPHQHMYGLEATIFAGLGFGHVLYDRPVFYPDDLEAVIASADKLELEQIVLVTSPPHLKFLADRIQTHPQIACVVSATAPLSADLARRVESGAARAVYEIYGSTETGSLAWRRTTESDIWAPSVGFTLLPSPDGWRAAAPHLADVIALNDDIELVPDGFRLLGRRGDMVQVAGKRQSLGALNAVLADCDAISDGVVLREQLAGEDRLHLVVVPGDEPPADLKNRIRSHMLSLVDPVFVPRMVHVVDAIPRNATGKVSAEHLALLLRSVQQAGPGQPKRAGIT